MNRGDHPRTNQQTNFSSDLLKAPYYAQIPLDKSAQLSKNF